MHCPLFFILSFFIYCNLVWLSGSDVSGSFTQGGYGSSFSSSAFKPAVSSSASSLSGYKQTSSGVAGSLQQPTGLGNFQSASSFQTQNSSFATGQSGQSALYPNGNASAGAFSGGQQSFQHAGNFQQQSTQNYQTPGFHSSRDSQSTPSFQATSASYQNASSQQKSSGSSFASQARESDSQSSFSNQSSFGSASNAASQKLGANKLADNMSKLGVADGDHAAAASQFDSANIVASSSSASSISGSTLTLTTSVLTSQTPTASGSASSGLGLTTQSSNLQASKSTTVTQSSSVTSESRSASASHAETLSRDSTAFPLSAKAPPNLPQGVPPLMQNMYVGQHGFPMAAAATFVRVLQKTVQRLRMALVELSSCFFCFVRVCSLNCTEVDTTNCCCLSKLECLPW